MSISLFFPRRNMKGSSCALGKHFLDRQANRYSEHTFDSVDAFMNEPFIEGKPLKDIIENFTI